MAANRKLEDDLILAEKVKRLTISAIVSEDDFFDRLVLKGGNAIEHTGVDPVRRSIDVDFSIDGTLDPLGSIDELRSRFESLLRQTFAPEGLHVFDVRLHRRPSNLRQDMLGDFWGGYELRFKAIGSELVNNLSEEQQRKQAFSLGKADRKEFSVDLSKHEYCGDKKMVEVDGYNVYVYSERMIVCEKIRAICQQMPQYREVVRSSSARPRARDFFDIYHIATSLRMDFDTDAFWNTLVDVFAIKHVPIDLIGCIDEHRNYHRDDFESVKATVRRSIKLKKYDFYVDYLVNKLSPLEPRWVVDVPST